MPPANAPPNPPANTPVTQKLKQARRDMIQAQKGYDSAMDLLTKSQAAALNAQLTADQALSAKIEAQHALESLFQEFKNTTDDT